MLVTLLLVFQLLGLASSIHAILRTRTPQGAIAWAVSLNALPIITVPAYWVFGRSKFNGYTEAWRDASLDIESEINELRNQIQAYRVTLGEVFPESEAIKKPSILKLTKGNDVELLIDGQATYESIHAGIEQAESYVLFLFYIIRADSTGSKFKEQLIRKARDGLAVYILYDELGSSGLDAGWISEFTAAGIRMIPFNTRQGPQNRFQLNFRNHRKIVVVDGKAAWIGGLNIGDEYLGLDRKLTPWRDTHLRINGPAALAAQAIFLSDWHWASKELLRGLSWHPQPAVGQAEDGKKVLIIGSGPADDIETASLFFTNALNISRQRIWIATPYFIPDEATMVALKLALLKGIDVRIITPEMNDNWFVRHAANVYLSKLSRLGARIYSYQKGFLHQKVMLIDDKYALVGTVNFDNRSFRLNFEITALVADPEFARQLETMLLNDLSNSIEVPAVALEDQSLWEQLKARGSALLAPVL